MPALRNILPRAGGYPCLSDVLLMVDKVGFFSEKIRL
jgi:hypothetical protein